jgi:hypothetical protein
MHDSSVDGLVHRDVGKCFVLNVDYGQMLDSACGCVGKCFVQYMGRGQMPDPVHGAWANA